MTSNNRLRVQVVAVTPAMAKRLLAGSPENRSINQARVDAYTAVMRNGEWAVTGQGIILDEQGLLLDGHHRLHAIIKSGMTIEMTIVEGVNRSLAWTKLDLGFVRNHATALDLAGYANSRSLAAAARSLYAWVTGNANDLKSGINRNGSTLPWTPERCVDFVASHPRLVPQINESIPFRKALRLPPAPVIVFRMVLETCRNTAAVQEFWDGILTGAMLEKNDPRLRLRELTLNWHSQSRSLQQYVHLFVLARAWNAFINREEMRLIQARLQYAIPKLLEVDLGMQFGGKKEEYRDPTAIVNIEEEELGDDEGGAA